MRRSISICSGAAGVRGSLQGKRLVQGLLFAGFLCQTKIESPSEERFKWASHPLIGSREGMKGLDHSTPKRGGLEIPKPLTYFRNLTGQRHGQIRTKGAATTGQRQLQPNRLLFESFVWIANQSGGGI